MLCKTFFFSCIWHLVPTTITWAIWWERNKHIFRKISSSKENVHLQIQKAIVEVNAFVQNHKSVGSLFTSWDITVLKNWKGIYLPFNGILLCLVNKKFIGHQLNDNYLLEDFKKSILMDHPEGT